MILMLAAAAFQDLVQGWLEHAFYPSLLLVFVIASLGVPIPEDIPLIAAGVVLKTHPHVASWTGTLLVSLVGIMSGDIILYSLGRRWGRQVFEHRSVSWLITPRRLELMTERFHRYGVWMVFFGRFMMGVRAVMCLTAGITRYTFWKFFLADLAGAVLSIPFFVVLGYLFAGMLPQLQTMLGRFQIVLGIVIALVVAGVIYYEVRRMRRQRAADLAAASAQPPPAAPSALPVVESASDRS